MEYSLQAWKVLSDLRLAIELLEAAEDESHFRIQWVAAVAIARAVGHVLDKVDRKGSALARRVIADAYSSWKQKPEDNAIFFEFVKPERDFLLKEYEIGMLGTTWLVVDGQDEAASMLSHDVFAPMASGRFEGTDCRDVLREAADWWEGKLGEIERSLDSHRSP